MEYKLTMPDNEHKPPTKRSYNIEYDSENSDIDNNNLFLRCKFLFTNATLSSNMPL